MLKRLIILIIPAILYCSCTSNTVPHSKAPGISGFPKQTKHAEIENALTDSAKLVKRLLNLGLPEFPVSTTDSSSGPAPIETSASNSIDLSAFKEKKLTGLKLKLRERQIGASIIDGEDRPSTFDLADSTFKSDWFLIAMKPRFFLVLIDGSILVALTYKLKVIDAMRIVAYDPLGNSHFQGSLNTTISKDLTLRLHYLYEMQIDEKYNYDSQIEDDIWKVNANGHFKFIKTKIVKELNN
ncbi:hypothetical protein SAMN05192574_10993 [Mucilaginibacter gossypiicola]|uniref:Uncharacterized protein n=1 Tax=Mucilaginibacter gossypiicola TaxID=551995 RepID=A0A1H8QPK2_9SPHI|nr:hypothetical protein [Mucilaginibacter gossypiicola]SEO56149.1 hypothetical protein SAMN05192574_10993 [Mucilaginibacter gossypiicola]